ncbi:ribonuclease HI [Priestia megaterium]|uniref:ribonuclease HI n=1 Tax=Priestia megaterium TaxID=1404 RepID=UPI0020D23600|nr:ribonuclease HI [Priestia megaterium]
MMNKIIIFCDGGVRGNGKESNIGGYGAVLQYGEYTKEIFEGVRNTTNNRMEIQAAISALKELKRFDIPVEINTDSAYLCNCINNRWYVRWMNNGWVTSARKPVENRDLWIELIELMNKFSFIGFKKVKGHSGNELNELADQLANRAMDSIS